MRKTRFPGYRDFVFVQTVSLIGARLVIFPCLVGAQEASPLVVPDKIQAIVTSCCLDCHSVEAAEASVRFDNFR